MPVETPTVTLSSEQSISESRPLKVGFVSLGCPKNLVDSEVMMGMLQSGGAQITTRADEADVIAHHMLMLFAQHHHPSTRYHQVQVRVGDIISVAPAYLPPPVRMRGRPTRKL